MDISQSARWAQFAAPLLAVALAATIGVGCGGDKSDSEAPSESSLDDTTPSASEGEQVRSRANDLASDGRLTSSSGEIVTNHGARRDRVLAVAALDQLQDDFRAGRMNAACRRINDFLLSQFTPPGTSDYSPCPRKLAVYASQRARRGYKPERLRLLWVRSYIGEAGIWVKENGEPLRIQMTSETRDDWVYDLGALNRPDVLAAVLVGAERYGER